MTFEIVLVTCDKTQWILPIVFYFFNKYLPKEYTIKILGFNKPLIEFPDNITFHSMGSNQIINNWSQDIYKYTKNVKTEYLMFLLDDFFLFDHLRVDKLNDIIEMMEKDRNIGLCNIGLAPQYNLITDKILINDNDFFLFEQKTKTYNINCQPSIYRTSHFNKYFNKQNSPWELELNRSHFSIQERLICCSPLNKKGTILYPEKNQKPIYQTQLCSGLSGKQFKDKLNMSGVKPEDLEELINMGLINKDIIIYK